jgi:ParB/RepB/Spo0J family partition protein
VPPVSKPNKGGRGTKGSEPGGVIVVGARKFLFSVQLQTSRYVAWWDVAESEHRGKEVIPGRSGVLGAVFVRKGLARLPKMKTLASSHSAQFFEFGDESEVFPHFKQLLGIEADPVKASLQNQSLAAQRALDEDGSEFADSIKPSADLVFEGGVIEVRCDRIRRNEQQPRKNFSDKRSLTALGRSLLRGQRVPIILMPLVDDPDHDYLLYDGERRWRAAKEIGKPTLKALVARTVSDAEIFKGAAISSLAREGLTHIETALAIRRIKEAEKLTNDQLAAEIGFSVPSISQYLSLLKLIPEVRGMLDAADPTSSEEHRINFSIALEIAGVPAQHQLTVARHIVEQKLNLPQARNYIRRLLGDFGLLSTHRRRKVPDNYRLFNAFLTNASVRAEDLLNATDGGSLAKIFADKPWIEAERTIRSLESLIDKLEKIKAAIDKHEDHSQPTQDIVHLGRLKRADGYRVNSV